VVPNHLFGIPSDLDRILRLCRSRGAYLVEDAAQAMGGSYHGRKLGTVGDVGFFSLGRGKNVTCGSGGVIVTNSDAIAEAVASQWAAAERAGAIETIVAFLQIVVMTVFLRPALYWIPAGLPFLKLGETRYDPDFPIRKLSNVEGALLGTWRMRLERSNCKRAETGAFYRRQLQPGDDAPRDAPLAYLRFPILASSRQERDRLFAQARAEGLGLSVMYPASINRIEAIQERFAGRRFPVAEAVAERLLTLPTHGYVSARDRSRIGDLLSRSTAGERGSAALRVGSCP
jgi:dTDP-4-amino-4,6-dideoxygalactose transaminase